MNRATIKKDRENQKRLLQELERLSDDTLTSHHHDLFTQHLHDAPLFSGTSLFFSPELSASRVQCNQDNPLMMDLQNTTHTSPIYEPLTPCEEESDTQQLQVDHSGTKVHQLPFSSAWLSTSCLTDVATSVSVSTSSCSGEKSPALSPACVAAAATAAMIIVPDEHVIKRPRSPLRDDLTEDEETDKGNTTDAGLEERQDPTSPRSISGFPKAEAYSHIDDLCRKDAVSQVTPRFLSPAPALSKPPVRSVQPHPPRRLPVGVEKRVVVTLSLDSSRDPAACRKRRAEAMERFRRKKAVRSFGRKVRYQIRKRIATTRPRVNGRFARRCDAKIQAAKAGGK